MEDQAGLSGAKWLDTVHFLSGCPFTQALNLLPHSLSMSGVPKYSELSGMIMVMGMCMPCGAVDGQRFATSWSGITSAKLLFQSVLVIRVASIVKSLGQES